MALSPMLVARHLSGLIGRPVNVVLSEKPVFLPAALFACYDDKVSGTPAVIKIDFPLLGSLSGAMMGIPSLAVEAQVKAGSLDELLDDAAKEIMNVMGALFQDRRLLFRGLFSSPALHSGSAEQVMKSAVGNLAVNVTVTGYKGGCMNVAPGL